MLLRNASRQDRHSAITLAETVWLLALGLPCSLCFAQAGQLDPTFGTDGVVIAEFPESTSGSAAALQEDGKIVIVGISRDSRSELDIHLLRLDTDGSLDGDFGDAGRVVTDFGLSNERATDVALQADGKIVVGGYEGMQWLLVRYDDEGSLDTEFGMSGKAVTEMGSGAALHGLVIQADGKILASGQVGHTFALARYNSDGSLDMKFGSDGHVTESFGASTVQGITAAIQADGKILMAGYIDGFAIARFNPDGSLDESFGTSGKVVVDFPPIGRAHNVTLQADGRILAAGATNQLEFNSVGDFAIARFNPDGSLDPDFGSGGKVTVNFADDHDAVYELASQKDGKIVTAGFAHLEFTGVDFALVRINPDGSLDEGFGDGGKITTDFNNHRDNVGGLVLQEDGKIIAVGTTSSEPGVDFAVAVVRYLDVATVQSFASEPFERYALTQNYPNPFSSTTEVLFDVPEAVHVRVSIYDLMGREVASPMGDVLAPGEHRIRIEAGDLASGIYIFRIQASNFIAERQIVLIR